MDLRLAMLKAVCFYLMHNVSTLNQCRNLSCGTVVCKHFASYQGYPNYRWNLIWYAKGEWEFRGIDGRGVALNGQRIIQPSVERESHQSQTGSNLRKRTTSEVRGVEFVRDTT
jgi:hypothetical protein